MKAPAVLLTLGRGQDFIKKYTNLSFEKELKEQGLAPLSRVCCRGCTVDTDTTRHTASSLGAMPSALPLVAVPFLKMESMLDESGLGAAVGTGEWITCLA